MFPQIKMKRTSCQHFLPVFNLLGRGEGGRTFPQNLVINRQIAFLFYFKAKVGPIWLLGILGPAFILVSGDCFKLKTVDI